MPANRDIKEVLKEIMANDGDVRKVPGLKPWRPENDKRNENQIGWDDNEWESGDGVEEEESQREESLDDETGIVAGYQEGSVVVVVVSVVVYVVVAVVFKPGLYLGPCTEAATSLSDANHQIAMLKIDLQTMKQEKMMKEKSASLQITNLNQKLQETRRVMEVLKVVVVVVVATAAAAASDDLSMFFRAF